MSSAFDDLEQERLHDLRALKASGASWADVLRFLAEHEPAGWKHMVYLQAAFGFAAGDVTCLGGWSPQGNGSLNDERIGELLEQAPRREVSR